MSKSIEEILGKGPVQKERTIPGTQLGENEKVRYVSFNPGTQPSEIFRSVTRRINPPLMREGGVMLEGCIITIPDRTQLYPLVFHGDVAGWQLQIERGAEQLDFLWGKIENGHLILSDGQSIELSECEIDFD